MHQFRSVTADPETNLGEGAMAEDKLSEAYDKAPFQLATQNVV